MNTDNTFYLISQIKELSTSLIEKELKKNNIEGISSSHGNIIHVLINKNEISMTDIANSIKRDRSTVTTLVKKLQKHGYVAMKKNEKDSRSTLVYLTEKGKELSPSFEKISNILFETSKIGIDEDEWQTFRKILLQLHDNLSSK